MAIVLFEPHNSYLLTADIKLVRREFGDEYQLVLTFENHSGIPGDELVISIEPQDLNGFKQVLGGMLQ